MLYWLVRCKHLKVVKLQNTTSTVWNLTCTSLDSQDCLFHHFISFEQLPRGEKKKKRKKRKHTLQISNLSSLSRKWFSLWRAKSQKYIVQWAICKKTLRNMTTFSLMINFKRKWICFDNACKYLYVKQHCWTRSPLYQVLHSYKKS